MFSASGTSRVIVAGPELGWVFWEVARSFKISASSGRVWAGNPGNSSGNPDALWFQTIWAGGWSLLSSGGHDDAHPCSNGMTPVIMLMIEEGRPWK